ncbi:MAG: DUF2000 domain-containing protein [Synergistales bacterium]|nr:DUF2000 domain-containing protein [Synergistales bacterium]
MKLVMVVNSELPLGLIANTAAVMGITVGKLFDEVVGPDISDADGNLHLGITNKVIPILAGTREKIRAIRNRAGQEDNEDIQVIDFSEIAQICKSYQDYKDKFSNMRYEEIYYLGVCLYGPVKKVNKLTGSLPLLR